MTLFGIAASVAGLVTLKFPIEIIVDPTFTISRVSPLFVSVVVLAIAMPVFLFWRNRAAAQNSTSS